MSERKRQERVAPTPESIREEWTPKTDLGRKVKNKEITDIDYILDRGLCIQEPEIVDILVEGLESELMLIGQSKGKFGGGQRRVFRQTQKKTREGNKPKFSTMAVVGNKNGYIGIGLGKSKETVPAREKAIREAKINLFRIRRGQGSWEDSSKEPHSIPFAVQGKCGSVIVKIKPAPRGKGLVVEKEMKKILTLAGIRNAWMKSFGQTKNKINMVKAAEQALRQLSTMKIREEHKEQHSIIDGRSAQRGEQGSEHGAQNADRPQSAERSVQTDRSKVQGSERSEQKSDRTDHSAQNTEKEVRADE